MTRRASGVSPPLQDAPHPELHPAEPDRARDLAGRVQLIEVAAAHANEARSVPGAEQQARLIARRRLVVTRRRLTLPSVGARRPLLAITLPVVVAFCVDR